MTNNTRVEHTAGAGIRYIENERQTKIQTATSTTYRQHNMKRTNQTQLTQINNENGKIKHNK